MFLIITKVNILALFKTIIKQLLIINYYFLKLPDKSPKKFFEDNLSGISIEWGNKVDTQVFQNIIVHFKKILFTYMN